MAIALKFPLGGHLSGAGGAGPRRLDRDRGGDGRCRRPGAAGLVAQSDRRRPGQPGARPEGRRLARWTTLHPRLHRFGRRRMTRKSCCPVRRQPAKAPSRPCQVARHSGANVPPAHPVVADPAPRVREAGCRTSAASDHGPHPSSPRAMVLPTSASPTVVASQPQAGREPDQDVFRPRSARFWRAGVARRRPRM